MSIHTPGADLGGGCRGCAPSHEITCGFLIQLVFCKKKKKPCGLLVLKYSKRRVHPLLKKILDPPLHALMFVRLKKETDPDLLIFFQDIYASKL